MNNKQCGLECNEPQGGAAGCEPEGPCPYHYVDASGCLQTGTREVTCVDGVAVTVVRDSAGDAFAGEAPKQVHPNFQVIKICDIPGGDHPPDVLTELTGLNFDPATGTLVVTYVGEDGATQTQSTNIPAQPETLTRLAGLQYNPNTAELTVAYIGEDGAPQIETTIIEFPEPEHPEVVLTSPDGSVNIVPDPSDPDGHTFALTVEHPPITCEMILGHFAGNVIPEAQVAGTLAFDSAGNCGIVGTPPPCECVTNTDTVAGTEVVTAAELDALCPVTEPELKQIQYENVSASYAGSNVIDSLGNYTKAFPHAADPITASAGDVFMVSLTYGRAAEHFSFAGWNPDAALTANLPVNITPIHADGIGNLPGEGANMYVRTWMVETLAGGTLNLQANATEDNEVYGASAMVIDKVLNTDPNLSGAAKILQQAEVETTNGDDPNGFSFCLPNALAASDAKPYQVTFTRHVDVEIGAGTGFDFAATAMSLLGAADGATVSLNPGQCNASVITGEGAPGATCGGGNINYNGPFATNGFNYPDWDKSLMFEFAPEQIEGQAGTGTSTVLTLQANAVNVQNCADCINSVCSWSVSTAGITAMLEPNTQYLIEYLVDGVVESSQTIQNTGGAALSISEPGILLTGTKGVVPIGGSCPLSVQVRLTCVAHASGSTISIGAVTAETVIQGAV